MVANAAIRAIWIIFKVFSDSLFIFKPHILSSEGALKKGSPSIIRATCRFDSKIRGFLKGTDFVSAYVERDKNFFRKIQFSHFLPSF